MREPSDMGGGRQSAQERLRTGIAALGISLPAGGEDRLMAYLDLLGRWNRVFNLTAVRTVEEMVTRHLLDSLSVLPHLPAGSLIDVGSGAGLPGIPIAVAEPARPVTLLDRSHKRTGFLNEVVARLKLDNVTVVCSRAEDYVPPERFTVTISRAFASLADAVGATRHLLAPGGVAVAMKGVLPTEEMTHLPAGWVIRATPSLAVPGLSARRHLIIMAPAP